MGQVSFILSLSLFHCSCSFRYGWTASPLTGVQLLLFGRCCVQHFCLALFGGVTLADWGKREGEGMNRDGRNSHAHCFQQRPKLSLAGQSFVVVVVLWQAKVCEDDAYRFWKTQIRSGANNGHFKWMGFAILKDPLEIKLMMLSPIEELQKNIQH